MVTKKRIMPMDAHSKARAIRQQVSGDRLRPRYHFLPPANWMNDPNGFIQWDGHYHLFYQHNPDAPAHVNMHWGHAVSKDLIHWTDLPIALAPTPGGPDEAGVFSGCAVDNEGVPTLIYTGVVGSDYGTQTQCVAISRDGLQTWEKYTGNPVIDEVPAIAGQNRDFRDPFVWREDGTWYLVLGSSVEGVGAIFLYRSPDLLHWEYMRPLLIGDRGRHGGIWECPNFFKLGERWVLIVSQLDRVKGMGRVIYFVGEFSDHRFTPVYEGVLDHGYLYAPLTLADDRGRRILLGWLREGRSEERFRAAGWAGVQSIPRTLSLHDEWLHMEPIPELKDIRGTHHHFSALDVASGEMHLDAIGLYLDVEIVFAGELLILALAVSPDGLEQTLVVYDREQAKLEVVRDQSSSEAGIDRYRQSAPHTLSTGEPLALRILLDGSVLEILANGRTSLSSRIYPARPGTPGLRVTGQGQIITMDVWEMPSIWR